MEKRNFFRLSIKQELEFSLLNPETVEVISNANKGILRDISGGGLSFVTSEELSINQLLEIKISSMNKLFILLAKIVRQISTENEGHLYAVEFVYLDMHTQDQLVQLIFNIQQMERKKLGGGQ